MTQMLLFDTPAANEFVPAVASVADLPAQQAQPAPKTQPARALESDADRGGMHHMGDLARLVLMRYELVAQRRAAMAAKTAK